MSVSVGRSRLVWLWVLLFIGGVVWAMLLWLQPFAPVQGTAEVSSLQAEYQQLRARSESVGGSWLRTLNPRMKDVQGDLTWNPELQKGMMRFINLPAPARKQRYRLWIHDSRAPDGQPLLGAVMAAGSGKQTLFAAIVAPQPVLEPFKFVLTMGATEADDAVEQIMLMVQP